VATQAQRSLGTQRALLDVARVLFAERGFADVSADEIVAAAGLTRGALHHHFKDKAGLFRAVFEQVEQEIVDEVESKIAAVADPAAKIALIIGSFLDVCERPEIIRIALVDAPAVLGWHVWRDIEAQYALGVVTALLAECVAAGIIAPHPPDALSQIMLGASIEAALLIAHATDRAAARADAERILGSLMAGLLVH